ncbi:MAG: septation protein IspZ [Hyphomonadaceae bacterium]|nr:septation protein IspZ [Hyphomonadaceae bacterium]
MSWVKKVFPFNAEQTVNIASEFGPLIAMFVVNGITGKVEDGTWALLIGTVVAMAAMQMVLKRLPIFPLIASGVTVVFGIMTLVTGDATWVQIKVTIFNALFAVFLIVGLVMKKNFFQYIFEKTFHYTREGWEKLTWSFAIFFIVLAGANEYVRITFHQGVNYNILGMTMDGVNVWIMFKIAIIMPATGIYAWAMTRLLQRYRLPEPERKDIVATAVSGVPVAHKKPVTDPSPAG